jgi:SNF2 family DNA or RNA helicase
VVGLWAALHLSGKGGPSLVVAPATVMRQWQRELRRWAPEVSTQLLHNSTGASDPGTRLAMVRQVARAAEGGAASVLITSYEVVRQHAGQLLQQAAQPVQSAIPSSRRAARHLPRWTI